MKSPSIYLIESSSRQDLAEMFMRFQEHYESPEFKGKVFSVDEFAHWYAKKYGSFSYTKDWYGFNIPATVLAPFRRGNFNPLTIQEQKLLEICREANDNSYIIGVTPSAEYFKETVKHEFVHGAFYTNADYRVDVTNCLRDYKIMPIQKALKKMGYHPEVFSDETNAYVLIEPDSVQDHVSIRNTQKLRGCLGKIFEKHFGFSVIESEISSLTARTEHILV